MEISIRAFWVTNIFLIKIDIDFKNIDIKEPFLEILIMIRTFLKVSISMREFEKILISIKYFIDNEHHHYLLDQTPFLSTEQKTF